MTVDLLAIARKTCMAVALPC